ncbi:TPA: ASCH domain-containing protein [Methanopyrus kandleri]|nr:ASCH domain-containing protein [Methanopyrus kandleri]
MPVWMSVKPKFANLILDGVKNVEVRRWLPGTILRERTCIVYASSPLCAVLGEVTIEEIKKVAIQSEEDLAEIAELAKASEDELRRYLEGRDHAYLITLDGPVRYPNPLPLEDLRRLIKERLNMDFHPNPLFRVDQEVLNVVRSAVGVSDRLF